MNILKRFKRHITRQDLKDRITQLELAVNHRPELIGFKTVDEDPNAAGWDDTSTAYPMQWEAE